MRCCHALVTGRQHDCLAIRRSAKAQQRPQLHLSPAGLSACQDLWQLTRHMLHAEGRPHPPG